MTTCVLWMNVAIGQLVRLGVAHARRTRRLKEMTRSAEVMGDVQRKIVVKSPAMICLKKTLGTDFLRNKNNPGGVAVQDHRLVSTVCRYFGQVFGGYL